MKTTVLPYAASVITGSRFNNALDWGFDFTRYIKMQTPTIYFYHAPECAVSDLMLQIIERLETRYPMVKFIGKTVATCNTDDLVPKKKELKAYNERDAGMLVENFGFDSFKSLEDDELISVRKQLLEIEKKNPTNYITTAMQLRTTRNTTNAILSDSETDKLIEKNSAELSSTGHWLPGTVYFLGRIYNIDRVKMLEEKLQSMELQGEGVSGCCLTSVKPTKSPKLSSMDVWISPRSPYSYIAIYRLAQEWDIRDDGVYWCETKLNLRPTMPSVMRGIPIPQTKKRFILLDSARVCRYLDIPFGFIVDPVGDSSSNVLKICAHLQRNPEKYNPGTDFKFLLETMKGCWSQGVDLTNVANLVRIGAPLGIKSIPEILSADSDWKTDITACTSELASVSLWGVPSFSYGDKSCWGQDRMWLVKQWCGVDTPGPEM